jgi:transposase
VLIRLRIEFPEVPIKLIWDGASYHRAQRVKAAAEVPEVELLPLSAYSPDFMPVEHLWQWLREDVTYHTCYDKPSQLMGQVVGFNSASTQSPHPR